MTALAAWPGDTQDPFWAVRKAGLIAELGGSDEAADLARSTVATLRRGLLDRADHIFALSREGWALRLLNGIEQAERFRRSEYHDLGRGSLVERFRQLRRFGADPGELADWLTTRLEGTAPQPGANSETRPGFEPGTATRSARGSDGFHERLFPEYQFLRFTEETGIPPAIPGLSFSRDAHVAAAAWFAEADPARTQSLMFRLYEEKILEPYLSRSRVAALPQSVADRWRADALRAAEAAIPNAGDSLRDLEPGERRAARRLEAAATVVARLTVRTPDAERQRLWDFAGTLATLPAVRGHATSPRALRALLHALAGAAPTAEVESHLPDLFNIPLPGEPGFPVFHPDDWPDPPLIVGDGMRGRATGLRAEQFSTARRRAVEALKSDDIRLRRAAMWRCDLLNDFGVLSATERRSAARTFWAPVLKKKELPWDTWGPYAGKLALSMPTPSDPSAAERFKDDILKHQLGEVHGGFVQPSNYFRRILYATARRPNAVTTAVPTSSGPLPTGRRCSRNCARGGTNTV